LRHADAAHLLGVEVGIVVFATPTRIISFTSIALFVYCAIVSVFASCSFFVAPKHPFDIFEVNFVSYTASCFSPESEGVLF